MSRADLSRETGLTRVTISDLVAELIADGFVVEKGVREASGPGKPADPGRPRPRRSPHRRDRPVRHRLLRRRGARPWTATSWTAREAALRPPAARSSRAVVELARELRRPLARSRARHRRRHARRRRRSRRHPHRAPLRLGRLRPRGRAAERAEPARAGRQRRERRRARRVHVRRRGRRHAAREGRPRRRLRTARRRAARCAAAATPQARSATSRSAPTAAPLCVCGKDGCLEAWLAVPALTDTARARPPTPTARAILRDAGERLGIALAPSSARSTSPRSCSPAPPNFSTDPSRKRPSRPSAARTLAEFHGVTVRMTEQGQDIVLRGAAVMVLSGQLGVSSTAPRSTLRSFHTPAPRNPPPPDGHPATCTKKTKEDTMNKKLGALALLAARLSFSRVCARRWHALRRPPGFDPSAGKNITLWLMGGDTPQALRDYLKTSKEDDRRHPDHRGAGLGRRLDQADHRTARRQEHPRRRRDRQHLVADLHHRRRVHRPQRHLRRARRQRAAAVVRRRRRGRRQGVRAAVLLRLALHHLPQGHLDAAGLTVPTTLDEFNAPCQDAARRTQSASTSAARTGATASRGSSPTAATSRRRTATSGTRPSPTRRRIKGLSSSRTLPERLDRPGRPRRQHAVGQHQQQRRRRASPEAATIIAPGWAHWSIGDLAGPQGRRPRRSRRGTTTPSASSSLPGNDGKPAPVFAGGSNIGISAESKNQAGAKELLRIIFSEEYQKMLGENGLGPANTDYVVLAR